MHYLGVHNTESTESTRSMTLEQRVSNDENNYIIIKMVVALMVSWQLSLTVTFKVSAQYTQYRWSKKAGKLIVSGPKC